jgi:2-polyprenyl-6-methoxyphenol hydroxylase-like FAD-dependent oxidoreductase
LADCESEPGRWVVVVRRDDGRADTAQAERDAAFLEHVREDVAWLLDEIERLKTEAP